MSRKKASHKQKRALKIVVGVLATFAAIGLGLAATYVLLIDAQTKEQASIANTFMLDLQQSKAEAAYAMTTKTFKANSSFADFEATARQVATTVNSQTPEVVVRSLETNFGIATTYIALNMGEGTGGNHAIVMLRKDDGLWRINGVQIKAGAADKKTANDEISNIVANATQ